MLAGDTCDVSLQMLGEDIDYLLLNWYQGCEVQLGF